MQAVISALLYMYCKTLEVHSDRLDTQLLVFGFIGGALPFFFQMVRILIGLFDIFQSFVAPLLHVRV